MSRVYTPTDISVHSDLAVELRVPLIADPYPRWFYVTAVVVSREPHLWHGLMPTDDELRVVASFNDHYRETWYRDSWKQKMRDFAPYDIDGGAVGRYLIKHKHGGWGYRKHTWQYGPCFVPEWNAEPAGLVDVLDRCHSFVDEPSPHWVQWKQDHADVFEAVADSKAETA